MLARMTTDIRPWVKKVPLSLGSTMAELIDTQSSDGVPANQEQLLPKPALMLAGEDDGPTGGQSATAAA